MRLLKFLDHAWRLFATVLGFAVFGIGGLIMGLFVFPLLFVFIRDRRQRKFTARRLIGKAFGGYWEMISVLGVLDYQIEGREHIERARSADKGIIVLCAHFTSLETGVSIIGELFPGIKAVYRPQPNEMIDAMIFRGRQRFAEQQIPKDSIRAVVRALRDRGAVIYLADLAHKGSSTELIPFFGEPALTTTTVSKLAKMTGATVLTYFFRRLPGNTGYVVDIGPPLSDFPTTDVVDDTRRLVQRLEDYIRLAPEQYMWTYPRFKNRPEPYPNIYRSER